MGKRWECLRRDLPIGWTRLVWASSNWNQSKVSSLAGTREGDVLGSFVFGVSNGCLTASLVARWRASADPTRGWCKGRHVYSSRFYFYLWRSLSFYNVHSVVLMLSLPFMFSSCAIFRLWGREPWWSMYWIYPFKVLRWKQVCLRWECYQLLNCCPRNARWNFVSKRAKFFVLAFSIVCDRLC